MHIPILIVISSCNESRIPDSTHLGYDYYAVNACQYRIYEVEEILFQIVGFDTKNFQLRETLYDSIVSTNQVTILIRQEVRSDSLKKWFRDSIWSFSQSPTYLSIYENSMSFTKPTFPVYVGNQWDGNAPNTRSELTYYYQNLSNAIIDTLSPSDHICVVIKDMEVNFIGVDLKSKVYVLGIGLIEKDYLTQTNCSASDCREELGQVISGRYSRKKLIEVGNE